MVEQPMRHQRVTETSGNTAADAPSSAWSSFHVDRHLVAGPAASDKGAAQGTAEGRIAGPVQAISFKMPRNCM